MYVVPHLSASQRVVDGKGGLTLRAQQKTTPREFKPRISRTKGHLSKRTAFVREIVKEVSGYVLVPWDLDGVTE